MSEASAVWKLHLKDEAKELLGKVLNARSLLTLSGCADIYSQYGVIVNVVQQVSLLPHQRYDEFLKEVEILRLMSESLEGHAKCNELCKLPIERKCLWPLYHQAMASLKEKGEICGIPILDSHETVAAGLSGGKVKTADLADFADFLWP